MGTRSEQHTYRDMFIHHIKLLSASAVGKPGEQRPGNEAFEVMQLAFTSDTAAAVARMAARFATGQDAFARLVREQQDARARWQFVDSALVTTASKLPKERSTEQEQRLRQELVQIDSRLAKLDKELAQRFPEYTELTDSRPLALEHAADYTLLIRTTALLALATTA
jgi:hypothetical protein